MQPTRSVPLFLLTLLGACQTGPDYEPPGIEVAEGFDAAPGGAQAPAIDAWWETFDDPVLEAILEEAFSANLDARASLQRIRAARALGRMESSAYWPQIGAGASYTVDRISQNNPRFGPAVEAGLFPRDIEYWNLGFDVAWELDVFGGTQRAVEASAARLQEQECQRGALLLSMAAEVARNYFEILGNQERLRMLEEQIANQGARIAILEEQQGGGLIPANQVLRGRARQRQLQSCAPAFEAEIRAGRYRLAVLLGRRPEQGVPELGADRALPAVGAAVPIGLPSELLRRRPDVLAAERRLAAATADIGVATAEFFPKFYLTGSPYLQAQSFSDLFSSQSSGWLFGPSVSWSLFSAGRNEARLEAARAREEQAFLEYEATVNRVLEEVESSLVRYAKDAESLGYLAEASDSQRRHADILDLRHRSGIAEKLAVLDSRTSWLDASMQQLDQEVLLLTRLVALHKALGGGWAEAEAIAFAAADPAPAPVEEGPSAEGRDS